MASAIPYDPESYNPFAPEETVPGQSAGIAGGTSETAETAENAKNAESKAETSETPETTNPIITQTESTPAAPKKTRKKYKLVIRITGIERTQKKETIYKMDVHTNLPRFRHGTFKDVRRTHAEITKLFEHLNGANPECFVPAVPPPHSSAGSGTEEDDIRSLRHMQQWIDRVSSNPVLMRDEEFIYFIESDAGYSPVYKKKPPATGLRRKTLKQLQPPYDETVELAEFRPVVKSIYRTGTEINSKLEKVAKAKRQLAVSQNDLGTRITGLSEFELTHPGMANMWKKLGKALTLVGDCESISATAELSTLGDGIALLAQDAYVAKEALTNRHLLMRELVAAQSNTKAKHHTAAKLKGSSSINPLKVDEAIAALEEATQHEEALTNKVKKVTENMLIEKKKYVEYFETALRGYCGEMALKVIESERKKLAIWESIRYDVRAVDANGGLSRLGREAYPKRNAGAVAQGAPLASQGPEGDSWSGDRRTRAVSLTDNGGEIVSRSDTIAVSESSEAGEFPDDGMENLVDARNAASLLAGSTF